MSASIVGTWNGNVDWGCGGGTSTAGPWTFNSDGTWSYWNGGGRWVQVGDRVQWNFDNAAGLIYSASINPDAMLGIMGYITSGGSTGCFYATRQTAGAAAAEAEVRRDHDATTEAPK